MTDLEMFKDKLEEEKRKLEKELSSLGRKNPENPEDWEALPPETETDPDKNITADVIEGFEETVATQGELEKRLGEVKNALKIMAEGKYGVCRVCGKEIEEKRLSANPAAETCIDHLND